MKFIPAAAMTAIFLAATPAFATNQNQTTNQTTQVSSNPTSNSSSNSGAKSSSNSSSNSGAKSSSNQNQTQAQALNAAQLAKIQAEQNATAGGGSTGAVSLENKTEGNKSFSSLSFGFTASNNAVNDDGYKGVKTYAVMSIFGGIQWPVEIDDETKIFRDIAPVVLTIWFAPELAPDERKLAKALACNMVPKVRKSVEDAGQECPE